jgi:hypothetical protein
VTTTTTTEGGRPARDAVRNGRPPHDARAAAVGGRWGGCVATTNG